MLSRAIRAALLKRDAYREVREDPGAVLHALGTVAAAGIAIGLGITGHRIAGAESSSALGDILLVMWAATVTTMVGWVLWVVLGYLLGSRLLRGGATYRQVLRALGICYRGALGICYGPGVLLVAIAVPVAGGPIALAVSIWVLVAGVAAVHEVQDVDWLGAVLSTAPGWSLSFLVIPSAFLAPLAV